MKSKLLPIILFVVIFLNAVLIFMLIKKPHQLKNTPQKRGFLTTELQFSKAQETKFLILDEHHKVKMDGILHRIREEKDVLFNAFNKNDINIDSLGLVVGNLEASKELEIFRFFKEVRTICTPEQQIKFDEIINKAIKGGNQRPARRDDNRPPREGGMPPPPPR